MDLQVAVVGAKSQVSSMKSKVGNRIRRELETSDFTSSDGVLDVSLETASSGQTRAELAVVLPLLMFLVLGIIQVALLGYGSVAAGYAAFVGARAAAVAPRLDRSRAAAQAVEGILECFPGLRSDETGVKPTILPLGELRKVPGIDFAQGRMTLTVRVSVPRLLPAPYISTVSAKCAIPMEPVY